MEYNKKNKKNKINIMNTQELRIGNYANYKGEIIKIVQFSTRTFWYIEGNTLNEIRNDIEKLEPIQLTDEILTNIGFLKVKNDYDVVWVKDKFTMSLYFIMYDIDVLVKLNFLHELQNLFFSLFKQELELK